MSKLIGGLFSTPSGHNNGLVFGKALTRDGKKTTVRQLVKPSNPNTTAQQLQRGRFAHAVNVVKNWGRTVYAQAFKSAIGGLAGFQSLVSLVTDAMSEDGATLGVINEVSLGTLHAPDTVSASVTSGVATITWSTELGANGNDTDIIHVATADTNEPSAGDQWPVAQSSSATRTEGTVDITLDPENSGQVSLILWAENSDELAPAEAKYSAMRTAVSA